MKKILVVNLIMLIFFSTLVFFPMNINASYISLEIPAEGDYHSWDNEIGGSSSGNAGNFQYTKLGGTFQVYNGNYVTSPNSFQLTMHDGLDGYWNLTTSFEYIFSVNFSFYVTGSSVGSGNMKVYDSDDNKIFDIAFYDNNCKWYRAGIGYTSLFNYNSATHYYFLIEHNNSNYFDIFLLNETFDIVASNLSFVGASATSYTTWSYIHWTSGSATTHQFYVDDFYIDYSNDLPYEGYTQDFCNGELDGYITDPDLKNYMYLESKFVPDTGLGLDGNITEVRFPISIDQYNQVSNDVNDYLLHVSTGSFNANFGHPSEFSSYDSSNNCYWAIWDGYTLPVDNCYPIFTFSCSENFMDYYWYSVPKYTNTFKPFRTHNSTTMFNNNQFDGYIYLDSGFLSGVYQDLYYCFTIENFNYSDFEPPTTPEDFMNTTLFFNFYDAKTGNKLEFIDFDYFYSIILPWDEGGIFNGWENNFCVISSLTVTAQSSGGDETHTFEEAGRDYYYPSEEVGYPGVTISPYGNNIIDFMGESQGNIKGRVDGHGVLFYRYTRNIILRAMDTYDVYLIRYGESNITTDLTPTENQTFHSYYGDFFVEFEYRDNESDSCPYRVGDKAKLVYYVNDSLYSDIPGYIFVIKSMSDNSTFTQGTIYETGLEYGGKQSLTKRFEFEDQYRVFVYNITFNNVKDELVYSGKNIVTVCEAPTTAEAEEGDWFGLPFWTPWVIGIFITLFVTMSPLIIATYITRKTKHTITIPNMLYVGFFFFGLIISVQIKFLPNYVPFIIFFGMVLYFIIQWLYGNKTTAEGE